jgi:hypothetical protein
LLYTGGWPVENPGMERSEQAHKMTARELVAQSQNPPRFFVEYIDAMTFKCYGIVHIDKLEDPDRFLGAWGRRDVTFTAPFEVQRGYRFKLIRASAASPVTVFEHLYFEEQ